MENKGLLENLKGNTIIYQTGIHGYFSMMKALGIELTPEQIKAHEKLEKEYEEQKIKDSLKFLEKWGEKTVKLHEYLTIEFGNPYTRSSDKGYKSWRISSWMDNCDQSEEILLDWDNGIYNLRFSPGDGYDKNVIIKSSLSEEYIENCIKYWAHGK